MRFRLKRGDESIVRAFATACDAGSVDVLRRLLSPEAVVVSDGGGQVATALYPVRGADAAARSVTDLIQPGTALTVEAVNGQEGVVLRRGGEVVAVVSLGITGAKVARIWIVLNPDKLRHWPRYS